MARGNRSREGRGIATPATHCGSLKGDSTQPTRVEPPASASRVRKFLALDWADRGLLAKSALLIASIRLALGVLPFRIVSQRLDRIGSQPVPPRSPDPGALERVVWSVGVASYFLPWTRCLSQALTVRLLLANRGIEGSLRIGVARSGRDALKAHAWVEDRDGDVLYDPEDHSQYTALPPLPAIKPPGTS